MATSSITKNFVVSGERQAEIFANAIEESANSITTPIKVSVNKIRGPEELRKLMAKRKKANAGN
jgi:hypothetical protein